MVSFPLGEAIAELWPLNPPDRQWRFGALGLGSRALMTPLLGLLVVLAASFVGEHARAQWAVGVGAWLFALAGAFLAVVFALDAMRVYGLLEEGAGAAVKISSVVALAKYLTFAVTSALLGRAGLAQSPKTRQALKERVDRDRMVFISGKRSG